MPQGSMVTPMLRFRSLARDTLMGFAPQISHLWYLGSVAAMPGDKGLLREQPFPTCCLQPQPGLAPWGPESFDSSRVPYSDMCAPGRIIRA